MKVAQRDPGRLLAVWASAKRKGSADESIGGHAILAQRDPGGRWSMQTLDDPGWFETGDMWIDTHPDGPAFVSYLKKGDGLDELQSYVRRVIPGQPAEQAYKTPPRLDHPAIAVDQQTRESARIFLVGGHLPQPYGLLAISDDGGRSWPQIETFPSPVLRPGGQWEPVVASGGNTAVAAWRETGDVLGEPADLIRAAQIDRSSGRIEAAPVIAVMEGGARLPFGADILPSVSVVRGGPLEGRAYITWPQYRGSGSPSVSDIMISFSDDRGRSWSHPLRVNDDLGFANYHIFPSVSARPDGSALVAWMDSRDDPTGSSVLMYGARVSVYGNPGMNKKLTHCPSYEEGAGLYGDYFNFDASQDGPAIIFPNIRKERLDSDIFLLE